MSYEEFLQWAGEGTRAEWVNGEVIVHMPPTDLHQATLGFLHVLLSLFVQFLKLGRLWIAPFEMRILSGRSSRAPDILFVTNEHLDRLTGERLVGPADLVVEIISDDSVQRDRREKFREYREEGVSEYWIIDPRPSKHRADFFHLTEDGDYELFATEDDERVTSHVLPGFWLRPAWLWQAGDLEPFLAFCEMAGLPAEFAAQMRRQIAAGFKKSEPAP
jgi:Uma2 family endonuclease